MEQNEQFIQVRPAFYFAAALVLLILPIAWSASWFTAAIIHELCHYAAIRLLRVRVYSVKFDVSGAIMETEQMTPVQELVCSLAGPVGGFLLLFCVNIFPMIALSGLIQSCFNLLPIYPLDGGRAVSSLISLLLGEENAISVSKWLNAVMLLLLATVALIMCVKYSLGIVPMVIVCLLLFRNVPVKLSLAKRFRK